MMDWVKDNEKREIERFMRALLEERIGDLLPHERFFLAETIGHAFHGLFGMARESLRNAYEDASEFLYYQMDPDVIARATSRNLERALLHLEHSPAQERPVFR